MRHIYRRLNDWIRTEKTRAPEDEIYITEHGKSIN